MLELRVLSRSQGLQWRIRENDPVFIWSAEAPQGCLLDTIPGAKLTEMVSFFYLMADFVRHQGAKPSPDTPLVWSPPRRVLIPSSHLNKRLKGRAGGGP